MDSMGNYFGWETISDFLRIEQIRSAHSISNRYWICVKPTRKISLLCYSLRYAGKRTGTIFGGAQICKSKRTRNHSQNTTETVGKNTHSICLKFCAKAAETSSMLCCCPSVCVRAFIYFCTILCSNMCLWDSKERKIFKVAHTYTHTYTH